MIFLFTWVICRFHVNFQGRFQFHTPSTPSSSTTRWRPGSSTTSLPKAKPKNSRICRDWTTQRVEKQNTVVLPRVTALWKTNIWYTSWWFQPLWQILVMFFHQKYGCFKNITMQSTKAEMQSLTLRVPLGVSNLMIDLGVEWGVAAWLSCHLDPQLYNNLKFLQRTTNTTLKAHVMLKYIIVGYFAASWPPTPLAASSFLPPSRQRLHLPPAAASCSAFRFVPTGGITRPLEVRPSTLKRRPSPTIPNSSPLL